jgi:hypothetical protein
MDLTLPVNIYDSHGQLCASITEGAAEGDYPSLTLHRGDILNVRNVQGGTVESPNLDLGAGSSSVRGNIVCNWDVGNGLLVYDGRPKTGRQPLLAVNRANNHRVETNAPLYAHAGVKVWRDGAWHSL